MQRPKHLDPVQSYTVDESLFTRQILEPPLQYHYLKRPYELITLTAAELPKPKEIEGGKFTVYEIRIRPGIRYQPHPAFVEENHALSPERIKKLKAPYDLPLGTRELVAADYVYQIKRLAHPRLHSPIFGLMAEYIVGLPEYAEKLKKLNAPGWIDLRSHALEGVEEVDRYTYRVTLKGRYPQFVYWLAMPFFAPIPWEGSSSTRAAWSQELHARLVAGRHGAIHAHRKRSERPHGAQPQSELPRHGLSLRRGTRRRGSGLIERFREDHAFHRPRGVQPRKGKRPLLEQVPAGLLRQRRHQLENFDQAVRVAVDGAAEPSPEMVERGIELTTSVAATVYYFGFNMKDPVVGGSLERARKLRQAISIAVDMEEYLRSS